MFNKILVAVQMNNEVAPLVNKANELLDEGGDIYLVHVAPLMAGVMPIYPMGGAIVASEVAFQRQYQEDALEFLRKTAAKFDLPTSNIELLAGDAAKEVKRYSEEQGCDLIILGLHEDGALQRVLGSTANKVLHSSPCNVLCVLV